MEISNNQYQFYSALDTEADKNVISKRAIMLNCFKTCMRKICYETKILGHTTLKSYLAETYVYTLYYITVMCQRFFRLARANPTLCYNLHTPISLLSPVVLGDRKLRCNLRKTCSIIKRCKNWQPTADAYNYQLQITLFGENDAVL